MEARQGGGGRGRGGGKGRGGGGRLCGVTRTSALFLWRWGPTKQRAPDRSDPIWSDPFSPSRMCTPCCLSQVRRAVLILCPVFGPVGGCRWFRLGVRPQLCAKSNYPAVLTVRSPVDICSHVTDSLFPHTFVVKCDPGPGRAFVRVEGKISSLFWLQGDKEISWCQLQRPTSTCTSSLQMCAADV